MEDTGKVDLNNVPLQALSQSTRQVVISGLQQRRVLPSSNGLSRDYIGLAQLCQVALTSENDSVAKLLTKWETQFSATLAKLEDYLSELDRWDIVDDIHHLLLEDAQIFISKPPCESATFVDSAVVKNQGLIEGDAERLQQGLELEVFDALLLYIDEDLNFANEMVDRLEAAGCKICLKDQLLCGLQFKHASIMQLIKERCRRVIVVISHNFIKSPANTFFVKYAQAISIEQNRDVVIPCIYGEGNYDIPPEISLLFKLDYFRSKKLQNYDFWGHLQSAVLRPVCQESTTDKPMAMKLHKNKTKQRKNKTVISIINKIFKSKKKSKEAQAKAL